MENQPATPPVEVQKQNELPSVFDALIDIIADKVKEKLSAGQAVSTGGLDIEKLVADTRFLAAIKDQIEEGLENHEDRREHKDDSDIESAVQAALDDLDISDQVRNAVRNLSFSVSVD